MDKYGKKVAVIGLGIYGLGALKNLDEAGFDVVGLERNDYVGGLWKWNPDPNQTSVLKSTVSNISKQCGCFSDFPFPDSVPDYPPAPLFDQYLNDYADHFNLKSKCRFGVTIEGVARSKDNTQWAVRSRTGSSGSTVELFDRVVIANGSYNKIFIPNFEGREHFKGRAIHSRAYKGPEEFENQRVLVAGLGNTGGDTLASLAGVAKKVYMSHRSGARVMTRPKKGPPIDHQVTRRKFKIGYTLATQFPNVFNTVAGYFSDRMFRKSYPFMEQKWKMLPAPPLTHAPGVINDYVMELLRTGGIESVSGIKKFLPDGTSVELTDGTILTQIDAVIFATGSHFDYTILSPEADPTNFPTPEWDQARYSNGLAYARIYQGVLSTTFPQTLGFTGPYKGYTISAPGNADLQGMAIAQLWAGNHPFPPPEEIEEWCDEHYRDSVSAANQWRLWKLGVHPVKYQAWMNKVSNNGVNEHLGWGWTGWKFWWNDRELYKMIMDGVNTAFVFRLFDGSRKKWDGAREAIYRVNGKVMKDKKKQ